MEGIVVEEEGNIDDAVIALFYRAEHSEEYQQKMRRIRFITPLLLISCALVFYILKQQIGWLILSYLIIAILWFLLYPYRYRKLNKRHYYKFMEKKIQLLGDTISQKDVYIFNTNEISVSGNGAQSSFKIDWIQKIVEINSHMIIIIKGGGVLSFNKNSKNYPIISNYFKSLPIGLETDFEWKF